MSVFAGKHCHSATLPLAYRIVTACYGRPFEGDGAVAGIAEFPYYLDSARRSIIVQALQALCRRRRWTLLAVASSGSGFRVVVSAAREPPVVVANLKRAATSALRSSGLDGARRRRWADGATCRFLWTPASVEREIEAVAASGGVVVQVPWPVPGRPAFVAR